MTLRRELELADVFCIATGAMIGSGLFILPGIAHAQAGPAAIFSYCIAGLLAVMGMLSQAELVSAMPKTGGTYFFVTRSMGPAVGTVDGLITWFSLSLKSSFALVGMAAFTAMFTNLDVRIIAVALCTFFVALNIMGVKESGRFQVIMVVGLLAILAYYVARGLPAVDIRNLEPFTPHGKRAVFATAGLVFISYGGLLKVSAIAEEVRDPARTIPTAMILSLFVTGIFYTAVVFVTSGVLGAEQLDNSLTPISHGAAVFMGKPGMLLLGVCAILAFVSTANAGLMAASRYPLALANDNLLPSHFARTSDRFKTPCTSLIVTGIFVAAAVFMNLALLVKVASTVLILTYLFSCLCVIIMRESHLQNYQPKFRSPFYPWTQIAGLGGYTLMIVGLGVEAILASIACIGIGLFVYWFYGRITSTREYALLHLVERITAKDLTEHLLETELKEIIRERDDITTDRFDAIIENAPILDVEEHLSLDAFFERAGEVLAGRLDMDAKKVTRLLLEREQQTSTVIGNGLAIPHIIVDGGNTFEILLARSGPGVTFPGTNDKIHACFVLAGTRDERNFHLRALSAIAQIAQDAKFYKNWLRARDDEALRDVILLAKRLRSPATH